MHFNDDVIEMHFVVYLYVMDLINARKNILHSSVLFLYEHPAL